MKKKIKIKGFLIKKKFLNKSELNKFERNLINFIYKFCIKSHKIISNRAKFVLSLKLVQPPSVYFFEVLKFLLCLLHIFISALLCQFYN